ncbi:MAG TPA: IclR family transcriptional regulator [Porticoccaceae bacterium]|jgi:uracil-DNA glycosylase|nr:IclR family transcriptional regulator [Porticoccaceae bacterium]
MSQHLILAGEVRNCKLCEKHLPHPPRPVIQIHPNARILIAGQAPGRKVQASGIPFDDASGDRLRDWMGISKDVFYNPKQVAIVPMGFCFPGTGKSGDLPPRPECAETWRERVLNLLPNIKSTLVIGKYAQDYHFNQGAKTLTELVNNWKEYSPERIPLPHPSPRNNLWLRKNPWFESDLVPLLQTHIAKILEN